MVVTTGDVDCPFEFSDLATAVRAIMSSGPAVAASQQVGDKAVEQAIAESLRGFGLSNGGYRLHNKLYYVIAQV
jgi:hypothetical protein